MTEKAYNQCVELHADNLYRFILNNIKDSDMASDIVQDAYEKMWLYKDGVDPAKAKSYLFTTAYHLLVDTVNKNKHLVPIEQQPEQEFSTDRGYSDLNEILHGALNRLPADQKMVLMLRDYEGYSYQEIGEITGLSESQVKVYIYRARVFLKKYIGRLEVVL